jgi:MFS family permease
VLGPSVGRAIDNRGGRGVLALSNVVLAAGLVLLGTAQGFGTLAVAWAALGIGMAIGLYDPAFVMLTRLYGRAARGPITGITLIAGFASTVGWPLSAFLDAQFGWRATCFIWAALHMVIGLALSRLLIPVAPPPARASEVTTESSPAPRCDGYPCFRVCSDLVCYRCDGGASAAPPRNRRSQHDGGGRLSRLARASAGWGASCGIRSAAHGASAGFGAFGRAAPSGCDGNAWPVRAGRDHRLCGVAWWRQWPVDDAKGTLPLAIFGPVGYGLRCGILGAPARATQAASPLLFGLLMDSMGVGVIAVSAGLRLSAFVALLHLKARPAAAHAPA